MEVVVTEEKKKIFRARKTMKISDRQQLEALHSTLLAAASEPSPPPPLMNGSHREDGQKDAEQNSHQDSNSPIATSPASMTSLSSPAPFLSLNLSPSPVPSQSPKEKDESLSGPSSPFHAINFEQKKEEEEKTSLPSPSLKETSEPAAQESKEHQEGAQVLEKPEEDQTIVEDNANDDKDTAKESVSLPPVSNGTVPMETDASKAKDTAQIKSPSSDSSIPSPSSSADVKREKDVEEGTSKNQSMKGLLKQDKMEVTIVKVEAKKEKMDSESTSKPSRPSSTPPCNAVSEDKNCTSGIKRTLSEGCDNGEQTIKRDGKRLKMEQGELEAQLELKITAKAGSHHKLEKIVQNLVCERLRDLEMTILEKGFQELKGRVDKIDCTTKHQVVIHTLQAKIARLSKKFGEANQASENKRKQESLAASTAIAAAAAAVTTAAKTASVANTPQVQRVLRRQAVEPQPETARRQVALNDGKTPAHYGKKEKGTEEKGQREEKEMPHNTTMAYYLAECSEGRCKADIKLRPLPAHLEKVLYRNSQRNTGARRPDRYASYLFRYFVPYEIYFRWVKKVNYVGIFGQQALPKNLRRTMRTYIEQRFPGLPNGCWGEIRDLINDILFVKRRCDFFQKFDQRNGFVFQQP